MSIVHIAILMCAVSIYAGCDAVPEEQGPVIFDDVERIELDGYISGTFYFDVPNGVSIVVLGVFNDEIKTQGQIILNEINFKAGSRTGLDNYVKGQVADTELYFYDPVTNDFDPDPPSYSTGGLHYWAVWGYDSDGNLTHASEQQPVTL